MTSAHVRRGWEPPQAVWEPNAGRAWFRHGPIDLSVLIEGDETAVRLGYVAAWARFQTILEELAAELPLLREPVQPEVTCFASPVACRMAHAVASHGKDDFITPMAAVAGAVADELLTVSLEAAAASNRPLTRVAINNGGDIALWLASEQNFMIAMRSAAGVAFGQLSVSSDHLPASLLGGCAGGVATSGWRGRSFSLGVADSVTVLAGAAAAADSAATLIANAVDLPGHPGIRRKPAKSLAPDSDLGAQLVTVAVPDFTMCECHQALAAGLKRAERMGAHGLIKAAALFLGDEAVHTGSALGALSVECSPQAA